MASSTDFNFFLNNRNPYKRTMAGRAGSDLSPGADSYYPNWSDVLNGTEWQNEQLTQHNALTSGAPGGVNAPTDTSNPFTTLRNVKNPGIAAAANSVLGQISSLNGPQPDTVVATTKSQPFADRLSSEFHNFDTDRTGNRSSLADFTSSFLAADPQAKALTDQDIASAGQYQDGSFLSGANKITNAGAIAQAGALSPAIQAVLKNGNVGLLNGANDSYVQAQINDKAGNLARQAALWKAGQLQTNFHDNAAGMDRNIGLRGKLLDNYLMRSLVPTQAGQQINANDLSRLYGIGAAENANTNYRITNPQTELATKLGLLGDVSRVDLANTFYGLKKPYEPNTGGMLNGSPRSWTTSGDPAYGGGQYQSAVDAILAQRGQPSINGGGAPSVPHTSTASGGMPPGTSIRQNADGTYSAVKDPWAGQYYMDPNFGQPAGGGTPDFPAGRYFDSSIPTYEGYDAMPSNFYGAA